jgi:hypothetical protein
MKRLLTLFLCLLLTSPACADVYQIGGSGGGGGGGVTEVDTGVGLTGGPITTTGTVTLAAPSATTIGGVESLAAVTHKWINTISTAGVPSATQPAFSDVSGNFTLAQFPSIANLTILGNVSGGSTVPSALTATQATTIPNVFTSALQGMVPASGGGTSNFLRADGTFAAPGGSGTVTSIATGVGLSGGTITTTGTLTLAAPSATTIGGVESLAAVTSNWINSISTLGVPVASQPAFTDISGTAATTQGGTGSGASQAALTVFGGPNLSGASSAAPAFNTYDNSLTFGGSSGVRPLPVASPSAPTITQGGTASSVHWSYTVASVMADGVTITAPPAATTTTTGELDLNGTNYNIIAWTPVAGAASYNIYRTFVGGGASPSTTGLIGNSTTSPFDDTGLAATTAAPTTTLLLGEYYNNTNWVQPTAITSTEARIHNSGTMTINGAWTINTECAGGIAQVGTATNVGYGGPGAGLGGGPAAPGYIGYGQGGSGGGHGGAGGAGGFISTSLIGAVPGGQTYPISSLLTGSGGGAGSQSNSQYPIGGAGGGSLAIDCTGEVHFTSTAAMVAAGGAGTSFTANYGNGAGGGSGGGIQIRSQTSIIVDASGSIIAPGGAGGGSTGTTAPTGGGGGGGGIIDLTAPTVTITSGGIVTAAGGAAGVAYYTNANGVAGGAGIVNIHSYTVNTRCPG